MDKLEELKRHGELLLGGEMPNVQALILQQDPQRLDYWKPYAFDCAKPAINYFNKRVFANDCEEELALTSFTILSWWKLQTRWRNLQMVVLHIATFAVSSAAVERAFSVLSRGFKKGDQHLEDYVESAVMLAYNCGRRESEEKPLKQ